MTDKLRELLEDVQTVYEGKGMVVHPNSFDKLRMEVIKLDNTTEHLTKAKEIIKDLLNSCFGYNSKTVNYEVKAKAEQFLKEDYK